MAIVSFSRAPRAKVLASQVPVHRRRSSRALRLGTALSDLIVITVTAWIAVLLRFSLPGIDDSAAAITERFFGVGLAVITVWILCLAAFGTFEVKNLGAGTLEYRRVLMASASAAGAVGIFCYLFGYELSRGFFVILFGLGTPMLIALRLIVRRVLHRIHRRGHLRTRVLVAGSQTRVDEIVRVLERESWLGYDVIGALTSEVEPAHHTPGGQRIVGHTGSTLSAVMANEAEAVIFSDGSFQASDDFRRMAWDLEKLHAQMIVVPGLTDISSQRINLRPVAGLPLVHIERPQSQNASHLAKRSFDFVGSSLLLLAFSPILLAVALAVKFGDGGKVLFHQTRVGRDNKTFECLKFRSMVPNAEALKAQLDAQNESDGVLFKMTNDPRITRVGAILRRFSLDELPQLINVWRGDMSLVGPRPPLPKEVGEYVSDVHRRLAVRPGMTGLWQVSGRSDLPWDETVRLDLYYVDNWSMTQDLAILVKTARAVFGSAGAY